MNLHQRLVFSIISMFFVCACSKDTHDLIPEGGSDFVVQAKGFYENTNSAKNQGPGQIRSVESEKLQPQWDQAIVFKTSEYDFAEVPLLTKQQKTGLYNFSESSLTQADRDLTLHASFQRLLVFRDNAGIFGQVILTYIPDAEYLKKYRGEAKRNSLDKMDVDFNGYLEYRNLAGKLMQVILYKGGKVSKKYLPGPVKSKVKDAGMTTQALQYIQVCTDWYQWDDDSGWVYLDTLCTGYWIESGDIGGGSDPCPNGDCSSGGAGGWWFSFSSSSRSNTSNHYWLLQ